MRKKAFAFVLAALLLCSCGTKKEQQSKKKDMPEDRPYNRFIMETDKGYYTNHLAGYGGGFAMRYYERDTDNQIFLCAKPECLHDGSDTCTATYNNLWCFHSTIYDGAIYSLMMDEGDTVILSIYKSALDGTSITKVGDAFKMENSSGEDVTYNGRGFIIHKGYAYISYKINFGTGQFGFVGSGLVKMDLSTGKTEELWSGENYFSGVPQDMYGDGDYVYYTNLAGNDNEGFFRYDINSGEIDKLWDNKFPMAGENKLIFLDYDRENGKYNIISCGKSDEDIEKANADGFDMVLPDCDYIQTIIPYEDKLIIEDEGKVKVFSEKGELLGEIPFLDDPGDRDQYSYPRFEIDISDGKVYFFDSSLEREHDLYVVEFEDGGFTKDYASITYYCPIDDIIAGTGKWETAYRELDILQVGLMGHILEE